MNKIMLMGRLTKDVDFRVSEDGLNISRYSLAVNRKKKDETDFINCVAFGKSAEFSNKYFSKGQQVAVVGRLQMRNWKDDKGNNRVSAEVIVEEQFFADSKKTEQAFYPAEENTNADEWPF